MRCSLCAFLMLLGLSAVAAAQEKPYLPLPTDNTEANASIGGHIKLSSGHSADVNFKVILGKMQFPLMTIYSDKNGEFVFNNLRSGLYYVQVLPDSDKYESATQQVRLYPGDTPILTFFLVEKKDLAAKAPRASTVTAGEMAAVVPVSARKEVEIAHKLIAKKDIEGAITHLKQAVTISPDYLAALNDLGAQYLKLGRLKEAAEPLEAAIKKDERYFNARLNLGIVRVEERRYAEAVEQLSRAIAIDSAHPGAHLFLGIASLETNDLPTAERELVKALVLGGPEYSRAHYYFAHVYLKYGKTDDALRELKLFLATAASDEMMAQARALIEQLTRR